MENKTGSSVVDEGELERLLPLIPRHPETGQLSSVGSIGHGTEECNPCRYVRSKAGCANGARCTFCHMPHSKRRTRPDGTTRRGARNGSSSKKQGTSASV